MLLISFKPHKHLIVHLKNVRIVNSKAIVNGANTLYVFCVIIQNLLFCIAVL